MANKMENYKISFGKYKNQAVSVMKKDKSYCRWFIKSVNNQPELKDYIINYDKYIIEIENNKKNKLKEIEIKMNGFTFFDLPNDILRKIFFMSKAMEYTEKIISINLKCEKSFYDGLYNSNRCLCCGIRTKNNYRYCYDCNMEQSRTLRDKRTKRRIELRKKKNQKLLQEKLNDFNKKWFYTQVIPKLRKIKAECNKPLSVVKYNSNENNGGYMTTLDREIGIHYL